CPAGVADDAVGRPVARGRSLALGRRGGVDHRAGPRTCSHDDTGVRLHRGREAALPRCRPPRGHARAGLAAGALRRDAGSRCQDDARPAGGPSRRAGPPRDGAPSRWGGLVHLAAAQHPDGDPRDASTLRCRHGGGPVTPADRSPPRAGARLMRRLTLLAALAIVLPPLGAQRTAPERTDAARTSTHAEVLAFLDSLVARGAGIRVGTLGTSPQGRSIPYVVAAR